MVYWDITQFGCDLFGFLITRDFNWKRMRSRTDVWSNEIIRMSTKYALMVMDGRRVFLEIRDPRITLPYPHGNISLTRCRSTPPINSNLFGFHENWSFAVGHSEWSTSVSHCSSLYFIFMQISFYYTLSLTSSVFARSVSHLLLFFIKFNDFI